MGKMRPELILGAATQPVQLRDLGSVYKDVASVRMHQAELQAQEDKIRQQQMMNDAYQESTGPDGSVDQNKLMASLAQRGVGTAIPGVQKANQELAVKRAEIADKQAGTDKTMQETLYSGLKLMDNSIASLAANPNVTDRDVMAETARLVNAGAFRAQAAQKGVSEDDYARELVSTMPVGNPAALKNWLVQTGMRVADASKRLETMLPKYDEQDRGGQISEGTINQMTGQRTAGTVIDKTNTPGEVLTAETSRRGQNMVDRRAGDANLIAREAQQSQVVETPQGYAVVNKGTANARPVAMGDQPVLAKGSEVAKNAATAQRMMNLIPMARELLQGGATASGAGAMADRMMNFMGASTKGADAAAALDTLGGWMTSNVPRFEGPQSDKDTETYKMMAGMVADRTKPVSTRMAALDALEQLIAQYGGAPGTAPATTIPPRPALPSGAPGVDRRAPSAAPAQGGPRPPLDSFFVR